MMQMAVARVLIRLRTRLSIDLQIDRMSHRATTTMLKIFFFRISNRDQHHNIITIIIAKKNK